jgi:hypothetical protein
MLSGKQRQIETDRLTAKGRHFKKVDFRYSVFEGSYLRDCTFDSCDFTGCRFAGTSFHGSSFVDCKFDYATFERTLITSEILENCCPPYENVKLRFARTLRVNFQQLGDAESVNRAILIELAAAREHLSKAWGSNESYYRKKYRGLLRLRAFASWLMFVILDTVWGNGESAWRLGRSAMAVLVVIALYDALAFRAHGPMTSYTEALVLSPQVFLGTASRPYPGSFLR